MKNQTTYNFLVKGRQLLQHARRYTSYLLPSYTPFYYIHESHSTDLSAYAFKEE